MVATGMFGKWFWIVGAIFLILKISLALLGPDMAPSNNTVDATWYLQRAASVTQTGTYLAPDGSKTARFPVGFPYLLGSLGVIFGATLRTAVILNSVLSLAAAALVYVLASMLFNYRVAIAAAMVMLIAPAQYIYSQQAFSEHLFTVLLLLALITIVFTARKHLLLALLAGVLIALACLTRGQGLVLLVWFPLAVFILAGKWRTTFAATSLMLLGWFLIMTPWWVRNFQVFDRFVLISNNGGKNLCVGNIDTRYARPNFGYEINQELSGSEAQRDYIMKAAALDYIRSHPGQFLSNAPLKVFWLYAADASLSFRRSVLDTYGRIVGLLVLGYAQLLWIALVVAALIGLVKTHFARRYKPHNVLYLLLILWALFHTIFFGGARFNFPIFPIVAIVATAWMCSLRQKSKPGLAVGDQSQI